MEIDYTYNKYRVHKVPMLLENKEQLKKDLLEYVGFFRPGQLVSSDHAKALGVKSVGGPGIQVPLAFSDKNTIASLNSKFSTTVLNYHNQIQERKAVRTYTNSWTFISTPQNRETNYHDHLTFAGTETHPTTYTWTYYLDVPDNCVGDEGKLFFSPSKSDEDAIKIFPELDSLYIFPANLHHKPALNPNSTNWRVVLAGNTLLEFHEKVLI
jgi:hypothetical protein